MTLYDSHCHLAWQGDEGSGAAIDLIERAAQAGVTRLMAVAIDLTTARSSRELARIYAPNVCASAGIHPHDIPDSLDKLNLQIDELDQLLSEGGFTAVGETGLDHFRDYSPHDLQAHAFVRHLELAVAHDLPVIVHCRAAVEPTLETLRPYAGTVRGVMHCFSGTATDAIAFLDLGLHISFAGNVTYPKADGLRDAASVVPLDRMLIETDSPFLAPQPMRGMKNEPANLVETARLLASHLGIPTDEFASATTQNAVELFR